MNIGIDIRSLLDSHRTGVGQYTYQVITHLINNDTKNHYYLFYNSFSEKNLEKKFPEFKKKNITICSFHYPNKIFNLFILSQIISLNKIIKKKYSTKLDAFWFPNISFINTSSQCKRFLTIHDVSFLINPQWFSIKRRIWHSLLNIKRLLKNSEKIITISNSTRHDIQNYYQIPQNKISVIPLGIPQNKKEFNQKYYKKLQKKYRLPKKYILSLCTLEPRKNLESIIQAFNNITTDHELVLVGASGWKNSKLHTVINASPKKYNIHVLGYVSETEKLALYEYADLFLFPSFFEGFGLPPFEALKYVTPVISSNVSSLPEVLQKNVYYCNPYDINSLVKMIEFVLSKKEHQINHENLAKYNWNNTAEMILEEIKKALL